jgi:hypothetical protein
MELTKDDLEAAYAENAKNEEWLEGYRDGEMLKETLRAERIIEAKVTDQGERNGLGDFRRFTVPMELLITASSKAEALEKAMEWRDAVAFAPMTSEALEKLPFDWHLHHPWGC